MQKCLCSLSISGAEQNSAHIALATAWSPFATPSRLGQNPNTPRFSKPCRSQARRWEDALLLLDEMLGAEGWGEYSLF